MKHLFTYNSDSTSDQHSVYAGQISFLFSNMSTKRCEKYDSEIEKKRRKLSEDEKSASSIAPNRKFRTCKHAKKTLEICESYFKDKFLTDVTLVTNSERIDVHRLVLSASSPYFAAMFKSSAKELIGDEIDMKKINEDALLALVQYCYTGSIDSPKGKVVILFDTACQLQMDTVVKACRPFLIEELDPCNCLGIRTRADARGFDSLSSAAHAYALKYFVHVVENQEFLSLSADQVAKLLVSEDVNVPSEETIFNALTTWLKHDSTNRIKEASKLLSYVRLPLLTSKFINEHIEGNELFNDQKAIQDSILEAYRYHSLRKPTDSLLRSVRTRPRKSTVARDILLALGRRDDDAEGVEILNCFLYAAGGHDNARGSRTVERCDLVSKKWSFVASMSTGRSRAGVAVLNNKLYVVGGRNAKSEFNTMECYDPETNKWTPCSPMSEARAGVGTGVLNGYIYAIGGFTGTRFLNSVERYDPETDKWIMLAPMSFKRCNTGVGVLDNRLFVVGGYSGVEYLTSVEAYDPALDEWQKIIIYWQLLWENYYDEQTDQGSDVQINKPSNIEAIMPFVAEKFSST